MKVDAFYRQSRCEKISGFEQFIFEEGRISVLKKTKQMVCKLLTKNTPFDKVLEQVSSYLKQEYSRLDVGVFSWQEDAYIKNDTFLYQRMFDFFGDKYQFLIPDKFVQMELSTQLPDGSSTLEQCIDLLATDEEDRFHAFIIQHKACDRSIKGKSNHTAAVTDLRCMVAKYCLEENYPGVIVHMVYLPHKQDTPRTMKKSFEVSQTATSNIHSLDYADYYTDEVFDFAFLKEMIHTIATSSVEEDCYGCTWSYLCKTPSIELVSSNVSSNKEKASTEGYKMPSFTEDQLQVVRHKDGAMCVCAGPGSGKTATIIGRIKYLVEECNVDPHFMLVVTFTNEAATELRTRCLSFLEEYRLPKIATLNAFCYSVLTENADLLNKKLKVLSGIEKLRIIQNIVSVLPPLVGFKYGMEYGRNGLYKTLSNRLDQYFSMSEYEFFQKNQGLGQDFVSFANMYKEVIQSHDYITFDEQISMCNELFRAHPDVLNIYRRVYQYVMVDEYQDVNEEQVKMLYALASHGNIVVVGDDDQNIYGFRGASAEYMINFPKAFKNAKTVVLRDNFRSTKTLVDAAQSLIKQNEKRIAKDIRSGTNSEGLAPQVIHGLDPDTIDNLIVQLVNKGYRYDDIAILSTKNAPLEDLHTTLKAPTLLAKSYLREDGLFVFSHCVMKLHENIHDDSAFYQYMTLFNKVDCIEKIKGKSLFDSVAEKYGITFDDGICVPEDCCLYEELSLLTDIFSIITNNAKINVFLDACSYAIRWSGSDSKQVLLDLLEKQGVTDFKGLYAFMDYLVNFEDESRVEVDGAGKVTLITCHDVKGKEFPVVLIRNDYKAFTEEVRRLFYVAVTRAKKELYIIQDKSCQVDCLAEMQYKKAN